jgi:hypothetical protein
MSLPLKVSRKSSGDSFFQRPELETDQASDDIILVLVCVC